MSQLSPNITNQELYSLITHLTARCNQHEAELADLNTRLLNNTQPALIKTADEFFKTKSNPGYRFNQLSTIINIIDEDITNIIETTSRETLFNLLRRNLYMLLSSDDCPISTFNKKLYVYDYESSVLKDETVIVHTIPKWRVCELDELTYLLNCIQQIIISKLMTWKAKQDSIRISSDICDLMYQNALQKILKLDFKSSTTITTIKAIISKICNEWIDM